MYDGLTIIGLIFGFGFLMVAGARLRAGSHLSLTGLFPAPGVRDWPHGVQEPDAPRFDVAHLDGLRRGGEPVRDPVRIDDEIQPHPEIVELSLRRIDRRR